MFQTQVYEVHEVDMAGSGRFPGWRVPIPMPGWQAGRPPAYPEDDHRARPIVLGNHVEAVYKGRRIVMDSYPTFLLSLMSGCPDLH